MTMVGSATPPGFPVYGCLKKLLGPIFQVRLMSALSASNARRSRLLLTCFRQRLLKRRRIGRVQLDPPSQPLVLQSVYAAFSFFSKIICLSRRANSALSRVDFLPLNLIFISFFWNPVILPIGHDPEHLPVALLLNLLVVSSRDSSNHPN